MGDDSDHSFIPGSWYIFIERYYVIRRASRGRTKFYETGFQRLHTWMVSVDAALFCAMQNPTDSPPPSARMMRRNQQNLAATTWYKHSYENIRKAWNFQAERGFPTLARIQVLSPMLGFLWTVIGMVQSSYLCRRQETTLKYQLLSDVFIRHLLLQLPDLLSASSVILLTIFLL